MSFVIQENSALRFNGHMDGERIELQTSWPIDSALGAIVYRGSLSMVCWLYEWSLGPGLTTILGTSSSNRSDDRRRVSAASSAEFPRAQFCESLTSLELVLARKVQVFSREKRRQLPTWDREIYIATKKKCLFVALVYPTIAILLQLIVPLPTVANCNRECVSLYFPTLTIIFPCSAG